MASSDPPSGRQSAGPIAAAPDDEPSSDTEENASTSRQLTLDDLDPRCEAIAASTGERCKHDAIVPLPYCADHRHLLDTVDLERMALKLSKLRV